MSSIFWRILPHATACVASDRLFLLDIRQDRYLRVPPPTAGAFRDWLDHRGGTAPAPEVVTLLARAGIFRKGDPAPTNALPERVPFPEPQAAPGVTVPRRASALGVAARVTLAMARLRLLPLRSILAQRAGRPPCAVPSDLGMLLGKARAFERARNLVPVGRNCLLDSLALDSWLASCGMGTTLVFAIVAEPFEAHCWLQTRNAILNESFDQVSRFTPIFAA